MSKQKEYTSIRRFYAWLGFIDVVIFMLAIIALAGYGIANYSFVIN